MAAVHLARKCKAAGAPDWTTGARRRSTKNARVPHLIPMPSCAASIPNCIIRVNIAVFLPQIQLSRHACTFGRGPPHRMLGPQPLRAHRTVRCSSSNVPESVLHVAHRPVARTVNATATIAEAATPATAAASSSGLPGGLPVGLAVAGGVALAAYGLKQVRHRHWRRTRAHHRSRCMHRGSRPPLLRRCCATCCTTQPQPLLHFHLTLWCMDPACMLERTPCIAKPAAVPPPPCPTPQPQPHPLTTNATPLPLTPPPQIYDRPSRAYDGNVGDEYDAWTDEGILEYYWGEHIHLGWYTEEERAAGWWKADFKAAKLRFTQVRSACVMFWRVWLARVLLACVWRVPRLGVGCCPTRPHYNPPLFTLAGDVPVQRGQEPEAHPGRRLRVWRQQQMAGGAVPRRRGRG
jgi:hypothetical protein